MRQNLETNDAVLFLRELFDVVDLDVEINRLGPKSFDVYMSKNLVLWCHFDGEIISMARPNNMSVKKKFVVKDKSVGEIRKWIEDIWVDNYANLAKDD